MRSSDCSTHPHQSRCGWVRQGRESEENKYIEKKTRQKEESMGWVGGEGERKSVEKGQSRCGRDGRVREAE